MDIDKRARTQWIKAAISFQNYQDYLGSKKDRFILTLIDLLYISNFKGGNATINEPAEDIEHKLIQYSTILREISERFGNKNLSDLNDKERDELIDITASISNLTKEGSQTKIDGFSVSYLSALLSNYFPNLIPILDRRILINLQIVNNDHINKQGQVKQIERFYPELIKRLHNQCQNSEKSLRELDKEIFILKIK